MHEPLDADKLRLSLLEGTRVEAIGGSFRALASSGARQEAVQLAHEREKQAIERQQRAQEATRIQEAEKTRKEALQVNTARFEAERSALIMAQAADQAKTQAEWRQRTVERKQTWERFRREHLHRPAPKSDSAQEAAQQQQRRAKMQRNAGQQEQPEKPSMDSQDARMKSFLEERRAKEQDNASDQDRGHDDGIGH